MDVASLRVLLAVLVGWVTDEQRAVIAYLVEENRTLRAQLGERRLGFTDDQRRRLAVRGQRLGRQVLRQVATIVTPDTLLLSGGTPAQDRITGIASTCGQQGVYTSYRHC